MATQTFHHLLTSKCSISVSFRSCALAWNRRDPNIGSRQEKLPGMDRSRVIRKIPHDWICSKQFFRSALDGRRFADVPDFRWTLKYVVLRGASALNGSFSWIRDLSTTPHQLSPKCSLACVKIKQISTWNAIEDCSKESTIARHSNILSRIRAVQTIAKDLFSRALCSDLPQSS